MQAMVIGPEGVANIPSYTHVGRLLLSSSLPLFLSSSLPLFLSYIALVEPLSLNRPARQSLPLSNAKGGCYLHTLVFEHKGNSFTVRQRSASYVRPGRL